MSNYPTKRGLDGVFFRVERDGKWDSICFTDLTEEEQRKQMENRSKDWLEELAVILAQAVRDMGDAFNIVGKMGE